MDGIVKYDIEGFARELGVSLGDVALLFLNYINEMHEEVSSMQACLQEGNLDMLQRVVHNIKGVSGNLTIQDVYTYASEFDTLLKKLLRENRVEDVTQQVSTLEKLLQGAEAEIIRYFSSRGYSL